MINVDTPFSTWLWRQHRREDPVGQLAEQLHYDLPADVRSHPLDHAALRQHLISRHAHGALRALDRARDQWLVATGQREPR